MKTTLLNALYVLVVIVAPLAGAALGELLIFCVTYHVPSEGLEGAWALYVVPPVVGFLAGLSLSWHLYKALDAE